jgi:2-polyprenyl-3-methyl-5-hydroxy-6-metoxy-1,4-benzoquinol methylase
MTRDGGGFDDLTFEDFRRRAMDPSLDPIEKIGFPVNYRAGYEKLIFEDILSKLTALSDSNRMVFDVGSGCGELPRLLMELCGRKGHSLVQVDSAEMLALLPDAPFARKVASRFPCGKDILEPYRGKVDVFLAYSVLHHVVLDSNPFDFVDKALELLSHGGQILLGDIPNVSRRNRFFLSPEGKKYHREFTGRQDDPPRVEHQPIPGKIDDALLVGILLRCRAAGFDAFLVPQNPKLPLANRREDLLIVRP